MPAQLSPITELVTATPAEIDGEIAECEQIMAQFAMAIKNSERAITRARLDTLLTSGQREEMIAKYTSQIAELGDRRAEMSTRVGELHSEFRRRGGWTRYYLVDANNGHVHSSVSCSSCYLSTRYYWLTSESGRTAEDVVEQARAQACTVCFPWAPVTEQQGSYRTPSQAEADAKREVLEAKRAAKRVALMWMPDGVTPLTETDSDGTRVFRSSSQVKTERAARNMALQSAKDLAFYGVDHPMARGWAITLADCVAAIAARAGISADDLRAELETKAQKWLAKQS
jgi:hypothetical protein